MRVALITACGNRKEDSPKEAGKLYKSPRIRYLYKRAKELGVPFFILSGGYGLISGDEVIEPYDAVMTHEKCDYFKERIKLKLKKFDILLFYKGGARKEYLDCILKVANELGVEVIVFGFGNMGDIKKLDEILSSLMKV